MKLDATAISTTDRARPNHSTALWSRAAPATASTLSSDIEMSAAMICSIAWRVRLGRRVAASPPRRPRGRPLARSSRYMRQATHSSSRPPARVRPMICSSWVVIAAKPMRSTVAPATPQKMILVAVLRRQAGHRHADDDGVVARHHQVDQDDLEQRAELGGAE